jgi:hypothetical protein
MEWVHVNYTLVGVDQGLQEVGEEAGMKELREDKEGMISQRLIDVELLPLSLTRLTLCNRV